MGIISGIISYLSLSSRWAEAHIKIARMTLTIKLDGNWSSFQLANSAPPLSVTGSAIAPSARMSPDASSIAKRLKFSLKNYMHVDPSLWTLAFLSLFSLSCLLFSLSLSSLSVRSLSSASAQLGRGDFAISLSFLWLPFL